MGLPYSFNLNFISVAMQVANGGAKELCGVAAEAAGAVAGF